VGANRLGTAPASGSQVTVNGTSGGPWLRGTGASTQVVAVIGGRHLGGCAGATSYSSAFGADTAHTWLRATAGGPGDFVPPAGSDGCTG
jgi:hypothetical protein